MKVNEKSITDLILILSKNCHFEEVIMLKLVRFIF